MTVLVTGAGGLLGLDLLDAFRAADPSERVVGRTRAELDITDRDAVVGAIATERPRVVVHAAAWTDVDACEEDPARCGLVNATAVGGVAEACARTDAVLVLLSTDHVFSGASAPRTPRGEPRGWREDDPLAPVNAYGRAKAAAEALVRDRVPRHHIVRTAWLSGARGPSFTSTMLHLARSRPELDVVDDQVGNPTSTRDLATAIVGLVASGTFGTVHLANLGWCSRAEQARTILALAGRSTEVRPVPSSAFPTLAPRPGFSGLDTSRATALGITLPSWEDGVATVLAELGELAG